MDKRLVGKDYCAQLREHFKYVQKAVYRQLVCNVQIDCEPKGVKRFGRKYYSLESCRELEFGLL